MSGAESAVRRTVGIVQARMTSSRFPGKVMATLAGAPMISRQWERMQRASGMADIALATSDHASDDVLVEWAQASGVPVVRGPLDDVLGRYLMAADATRADVVVRLTADCPLTCPEIIDLVISRFHEAGADYCSNTLVPTFPDGVDVEVVDVDVLREVARTSSDPHEREHVTLGVYRRETQFHLVNVGDEVDRSALRWTVDTEEDLEFVRTVYARLGPAGEPFGYEDILAFLARDPALARRGRRNAALDGLDTGAMEHRRADGS